MMTKLMVVMVAASAFAGSSNAAEAGRLRELARTAKDVVKVGALMTRCGLKGKFGQVIC